MYYLFFILAPVLDPRLVRTITCGFRVRFRWKKTNHPMAPKNDFVDRNSATDMAIRIRDPSWVWRIQFDALILKIT